VAVDEGAEAVDDAWQAEVVGVAGVVGTAVGRADAGGSGVGVFVQDAGEQGGRSQGPGNAAR